MVVFLGNLNSNTLLTILLAASAVRLSVTRGGAAVWGPGVTLRGSLSSPHCALSRPLFHPSPRTPP